MCSSDLREAKALAKLNHPNIVKALDYGVHEGAPYLVMEYIDGVTLKDVKKPLRVDAAVRLLRPVAEALEYVHGQGLLHRDIKPSNIMITRDEHGSAAIPASRRDEVRVL